MEFMEEVLMDDKIEVLVAFDVKCKSWCDLAMVPCFLDIIGEGKYGIQCWAVGAASKLVFWNQVVMAC